MILVAPAGCAVTDPDFARALSSVLRYLVDACKTRAFNVSVYTPPDPRSGSEVRSLLYSLCHLSHEPLPWRYLFPRVRNEHKASHS
jgi:hypothetical protein